MDSFLTLAVLVVLCFIAFKVQFIEIHHSKSDRYFSLQQSFDRDFDWGNSQGNVHILVVYPAEHNLTYQLGESICKGASSFQGSLGTTVRFLPAQNCSFEIDVKEWADAVIIGSPVINANVDPSIQSWIEQWDLRADLSDKVGAAFVSAGGMSAGEELAMMNIIHSMMIFRMIIVGGERWNYAFGASAISGEQPFGLPEQGEPQYFPDDCYSSPDIVHQMFLDKGFGLGQRVSNIAHIIRQGSISRDSEHKTQSDTESDRYS